MVLCSIGDLYSAARNIKTPSFYIVEAAIREGSRNLIHKTWFIKSRSNIMPSLNQRCLLTANYKEKPKGWAKNIGESHHGCCKCTFLQTRDCTDAKTYTVVLVVFGRICLSKYLFISSTVYRSCPLTELSALLGLLLG